MKYLNHRTLKHLVGALLLPLLLLRKWYFLLRYKSHESYVEQSAIKAIRKANELRKETGYRYIVFMAGGKITIKPKRVIKGMLACRGKYFAKGTTISDIEKRALYITN
jgi:hypothetical protein